MYLKDKLILGQTINETFYAPDESHLMTIGHTGAGKGVAALIPNLLNYKGSIVCVDIKGEAARLTVGFRQSLGQDVWVVDPFNASGLNVKASIDPFSLFKGERIGSNVDQARALARAILPTNYNVKDPFWDNKARQLLTCLILYVASSDRSRNGMAEVRYLLNTMVKDADRVRSLVEECRHMAVKSCASALYAEPRVMQSIISTAQSALDELQSTEVLTSLASRKSIDLDKVRKGENVSIFLVLPPHLLASMSSLMRIWLVTLFQVIYSRKECPKLETLFLVDEAAQLGPLEELRQAITLMRGYGVRTWTYWQDLSQLKRHYHDDWMSLVNNSLALQFLGAHTGMAKSEVCEVLGNFSYREIEDMDEQELLLLCAGKPKILNRLSFLSCKTLLSRSRISPNLTNQLRLKRQQSLKLVDM